MLCSDQTAAQAMSLDAQLATSENDDDCKTTDHLLIPESAAECSMAGSSGSRNIHTRYCGSNLNFVDGLTKNTAICDCTAPFTVGIWTDNVANQQAAIAIIAINTIASKGKS